MAAGREDARSTSAPWAAHRYSGREWARVLLVSAGIGVGITLLIGLASPQPHGPAVFVAGAFVGACVGLGAAGFDCWVVGPLERFRRLPMRSLRILGFFVGGVAGWLAGAWLSSVALVDPWPRAGWRAVLVFGGISVVVGLLFEAYARLRHGLERSIAELKEREFAEKELETARAMQRRLLPSDTARGDGYRLAAINLPARVVAGDFYDFFRLPDGSLGVAVADVAGKGMGASLIMASAKAMLPLVAAELRPAEALREMNRRLHADLARREFVALVLLRFEPETGEVELSNAGLPDPYLLAAGRAPEVVEVAGPRLPLGLRPDVPYRSRRLVLHEGDRLLLFTDGLAEARDERNEPFGYERLANVLANAPSPIGGDESDLRSWLGEIAARVGWSAGSPLEDDCTALVLERFPAAVGNVEPRAAVVR